MAEKSVRGRFFKSHIAITHFVSEEKKDCVQKEAVRCEEVEGEIMSKREEDEEEGYGKKRSRMRRIVEGQRGEGEREKERKE